MNKILGVYSPLNAKLAEKNGFKYLWVSGYSIASDKFAYPDLDLMSYTEKLDVQTKIIDSTNLKTIVDIDNGIENIYSFEKYLKKLNLHSPYGICLEDEKHPKVSALYKNNSGIMDTDIFIEYLQIVKKNTNAKLFARTNAIVRNVNLDEIILRIEKIIDMNISSDIVLHGNCIETLEHITLHFKNKANFYLITSLLNNEQLEKVKSLNFSGLIIGHNLLFETINFQNNYLQEMLDEASLQEPNKNGKKIIENLVLEDKYEKFNWWHD